MEYTVEQGLNLQSLFFRNLTFQKESISMETVEGGAVHQSVF